MIAVITGDIINSRALPEEWITVLKSTLEGVFDKKAKWEIFRGDSFQIELKTKEALLNAVYIKACIKVVKNADVRLSIGIGKNAKTAERVTEANGEAYINSGEAFDMLKANKVNMVIKTPFTRFDADINLNLRLALIAMDSWGQITAEVVKHALENQDVKQDKLAKITGKSQSSVSEALKRAHFAEIMELERKYRNQVSKLFK